jgi:protoheme IX farnesyltransferase
VNQHHIRSEASGWEGISQGVRDFGLLVKFRLTLLVLYSALMSYAIVARGDVAWAALIVLALGGFCVTAAANTLNQVLERDYDRLMPRTANRPVATGRWSVSKAVLWAGLLALLGISLLTLFNPLTGFLGTLSLISYAFVYTPLKRLTPLAVLVGAVPGALPLIIGAVALEQVITPAALLLFALQFLWQFPHFWAVAWLADDDYKRAGYYLLPSRSGERDATVGLWSLAFCGLLVVTTAIGYAVGFTGALATAGLMALHLFFAWRCFELYRTCSRQAARRQMFASFLHLPLALIVILIDKI